MFFCFNNIYKYVPMYDTENYETRLKQQNILLQKHNKNNRYSYNIIQLHAFLYNVMIYIGNYNIVLFKSVPNNNNMQTQ